MSKIMFQNGDFALISADVVMLEDSKDCFSLALEVDSYNKEFASPETNHMIVYFRNQESRDDGKEPVPYADKARKLKLTKGSSVLTYVRFTDENHTFANGYSIRYSGVLSMKSGSGNDAKTYCCVKGLVIEADSRFDSAGEEYTRFSVSTGKDANGKYIKEVVHVRPMKKVPKLAENALKALSPRDCKDGILYSSACFLCGEPFAATSKNGESFNIYTAFGFDKGSQVLGVKKPNRGQAAKEVQA